MNIDIPKIKQAMRNRGVSQADIASSLDVSREAVSKWLRGATEPRPAKALGLSRMLGLSFDQMYVTATAEEPRIAFRKKAATKTTSAHYERAKDMALLLRNLVEYLPFDTMSHPASFIEPSLNRGYIARAALETRNRMRLTSEVVSINDIVKLFEDVHAVLIPVLWGTKRVHENALHIYLPESRTTWVYLNLNSKILDFKFWMAHELAHVKTPDLETAEADRFGDLFAAELLFPMSIAERYMDRLHRCSSAGTLIGAIQDIAAEFVVSPVTVLNQVNLAAESSGEKMLEVDVHPSTANFHKRFKDVNEIIFGTDHPAAIAYIRECNETFKSPFFEVLSAFIRNSGKSSSFVQRVLNIGALDAKNLYRALTDDENPA